MSGLSLVNVNDLDRCRVIMAALLLNLGSSNRSSGGLIRDSDHSRSGRPIRGSGPSSSSSSSGGGAAVPYGRPEPAAAAATTTTTTTAGERVPRALPPVARRAVPVPYVRTRAARSARRGDRPTSGSARAAGAQGGRRGCGCGCGSDRSGTWAGAG